MQKNIFLLLALGMALAGCHSAGGTEGHDNDSTAATATTTTRDTTMNELTPDEQAQGWKLLFNGKNLDGWRGYQHKPITAWDAADGTIHCNGHKEGAPATDLITNDEYADFELSLQWKIAPASNSGIMFHVDEKNAATYESGPEYQLIDDEGWPGKLEDWQHTGSNYAMQVPSTRPVKPVGEWNTTRIVVNGPHVEHWLNGEKILEYELWSPEWKKQKEAGKWKDHPDYGMAKSGHIALQYHGGDVWFRNIKLKTL